MLKSHSWCRQTSCFWQDQQLLLAASRLEAFDQNALRGKSRDASHVLQQTALSQMISLDPANCAMHTAKAATWITAVA